MILPHSEPSEDEGAWVRVESYSNRALAELGKRRLDENGIASKIYDEIMGSFYSDAVGGIRLMVRSGDFNLARSVLESDQPAGAAAFDPQSEITPATPYCFRCHSKDVRREPLRGPAWKRLLFRLFGLRATLHCQNCGHDWKI